MKMLPNGFCLFNFAAAAAVYALSLQKLDTNCDDIDDSNRNYCNKVSIIDWDVRMYGFIDKCNIFTNTLEN